jgi:hypothetical protein
MRQGYAVYEQGGNLLFLLDAYSRFRHRGINKMTAKDAKQQTIFVNQRKQEFEKKMKPYFDNIRISIEKGEYHYEFNTIPEDVRTELRKLGYNIRESKRYGEGSYGEDVYYHTVSWN